MTTTKLKISVLQLLVDGHSSKQQLLYKAVDQLRNVVKRAPVTSSPHCVILPEYFCAPTRRIKAFERDAENIPEGEICRVLSEEAKNHGVYIVGGSLVSRVRDENRKSKDAEGEKLFVNTVPVFDPQGELVTTYSKMHRSIIDYPGMKITRDLETGSKLSTFDMGPSWKAGLAVCSDLMFPELTRLYRDRGCNLIIAVNMWRVQHVGKLYKPVAICRAAENQVYLTMASQARQYSSVDAMFVGRSLVVSPSGDIVRDAGTEETSFTVEVDADDIAQTKHHVDYRKLARNDLYKLVWIGEEQ